jgi:hypothetical protein
MQHAAGAGDLVTFPCEPSNWKPAGKLVRESEGFTGNLHKATGLPDRRCELSPGVSGECEYWAVAVGGVADQHGLSRGYLYALPSVVA